MNFKEKLNTLPKSFKLFAQTITITSNERDFIESADRVALASYRTNEIQINPMFLYKNQEQLEHAFLHELMHFVLYYAQDAYRKDLDELMHRQESFVDLTANLLHQAFTTME